jgi:hypothetical protein
MFAMMSFHLSDAAKAAWDAPEPQRQYSLDHSGCLSKATGEEGRADLEEQKPARRFFRK